MYHILFNPLSNNSIGEKAADEVRTLLNATDAVAYDVREIASLSAFFDGLASEDVVVLTGGDGTLNHFINDLGDYPLHHKLLYYPSGSGNDFATDVADAKDEHGMISLAPYLSRLPTVTVGGVTRKFINGIGFGIDGYCCEVGEEMRRKNEKKINYTSIAIQGLLFHFTPANATVTVDGVTYTYPKAWIAPTMKGRYYGGGMMVAPDQDRCSEDGKLSFATVQGTGRVSTLMIFPGIFKGEHVKHTKNVHIHEGHHITVRFDRPCALQIDGETVRGVTEYTVTSHRAPSDR